ncbi:hypothetical protein [Cypionkella psychrotolerans]|uniref:hypothetical protein n=1 Tax=Cypionkella psychrotolerans TaxID=1678131 RepID=UPI0006B4C094|nr:hypothetical protein [Cypionkella psychrotolerans]
MVGENPPVYRIRLFLSVDLVGSTAYKSKDGNTNLKWIKAFQKFYGEFPSQLIRNYQAVCSEIPEIGASETTDTPKVWKTIGDEILFVNRVTSITHVGAYVTAFTKTLIEFGREVNAAFGLNTKGNAWIAAFPNPNRSIKLSINGSDPLSGDSDILTEEFEAAVDLNPSEYDFLGKGIDGGFRISRNSTMEDFTISPALAHILCRAKRNIDMTNFDCRFVFHEPQQFKGVLNGEKYPVISLITSRDDLYDEIQTLEGSLLDRPRAADFVKLFEYLDVYIKYYRIERPELKLTFKSAEVSPPEHYLKYIDEWREDLQKIQIAKSFEESAAQEGNDPKSKVPGTKDQLPANLVDVVKFFTERYISHLNESKLVRDQSTEQKSIPKGKDGPEE